MPKLGREFYGRDTLTVARELLGKYLVRGTAAGPLAVRVTETEGYVGPVDKACHAYGYKRTKRTETLFAPPGTAYLYLIYGMYTCLNLVTEAAGEPCAVLLRAGEARLGGEEMAQNRFGRGQGDFTPYQRKHFLNGPGKLCRALALTPAFDGLDLTGDTLYVTDSLADLGTPPWPGDERVGTIHTGPRIGIDYAEEAAAFPWRFWL